MIDDENIDYDDLTPEDMLLMETSEEIDRWLSSSLEKHFIHQLEQAFMPHGFIYLQTTPQRAIELVYKSGRVAGQARLAEAVSNVVMHCDRVLFESSFPFDRRKAYFECLMQISISTCSYRSIGGLIKVARGIEDLVGVDDKNKEDLFEDVILAIGNLMLTNINETEKLNINVDRVIHELLDLIKLPLFKDKHSPYLFLASVVLSPDSLEMLVSTYRSKMVPLHESGELNNALSVLISKGLWRAAAMKISGILPDLKIIAGLRADRWFLDLLLHDKENVRIYYDPKLTPEYSIKAYGKVHMFHNPQLSQIVQHRLMKIGGGNVVEQQDSEYRQHQEENYHQFCSQSKKLLSNRSEQKIDVVVPVKLQDSTAGSQGEEPNYH